MRATGAAIGATDVRGRVAMDFHDLLIEIHDPVVLDAGVGVDRGLPPSVEAEAGVRDLDDERRNVNASRRIREGAAADPPYLLRDIDGAAK